MKGRRLFVHGPEKMQKKNGARLMAAPFSRYGGKTFLREFVLSADRPVGPSF